MSTIMSSNCHDNDSVDDDNHHQQLLCRPVGFYPLPPAERNALNNMHDDFSTIAPPPLLKNGDDDGPTVTCSITKRQEIPIKGSRTATKSDSSRRWQNRRHNARKIAKKARFRLFAEWLIETFGKPFLTTSTANNSSSSAERRHIIDVAGGRGRMALELAIDRGIPCIVVDPVPVTLSVHTTRRIVNLAKDDMSNTADCKEETTTMDNNNQVMMMDITTTTQNNDDHIDSNKKPFILLNDKEFHRMDVNVLLQTSAFMKKVGFAFHQCLFNSDYIQKCPDIWRNASMVIGMHPDEATECIVDQALLANKSFAVVPCCVFPTLFPWRTITTTLAAAAAASVDGIQQQAATTPVRTLDQFIVYLCAKDSRIQTHILDDMEGSNTVVYMKV